MDLQTIIGLIALAAAAGFGTGKINLQSILSLFQKKDTPALPATVVTTLSTVPTKEEACQAALVLLSYSIANGNDNLSELTDIAKNIYHGS